MVLLADQLKVAEVALRRAAEEPDAEALRDAIEAAWAAYSTVQTGLTAATDLDGEDLDAFVEALERLPHFLVVRWLEERATPVLLALRATGVIQADGDRSVEVFDRAQWQALLDDPAAALASFYAWGPGLTWKTDQLLVILDITTAALGFVPRWDGIPASWVDAGWIDATTHDLQKLATLRVPLVGFRDGAGRIVNQAGLRLSPLGSSGTAALDGAMLSPWSTFDSGDITLGGFAFEVPVALDDPGQMSELVQAHAVDAQTHPADVDLIAHPDLDAVAQPGLPCAIPGRGQHLPFAIRTPMQYGIGHGLHDFAAGGTFSRYEPARQTAHL